MSHPVVHIELSAANLEETATFYKDLFGWETRAFPEMNYITFDFGIEGIGGGFNPVQEQFPAGTVTFYIEVDDAEAKLAEIEEHGGTIVAPPMEVPGVGILAFFNDLTGNMVALLQPAEMEG